MNVEGLSTETLRVLVYNHGIKKPKDLYTFDFHKLNGKAGFGAKKIANIEMALKESKNCTKDKFMYSMVIPNVGRTASKLIIDYLDKSNQTTEWYELSGYDVTRMSILSFFQNRDVVQALT
jgi:DNA ligase (NAD+)